MSLRRCRHLIAWISCIVLAWLPTAHAGAPELRAFMLDDLFQLEGIGEAFGGPYSFSQRGSLAFVRLRPRSSVADYRWEWLAGNAAADIWLQQGQSVPANLTRGSEDGSGWWAPAWSPDGNRLAMLSTRGGTIRVWLWEHDKASVRLLVDEAVAARGGGQPYHWLDDHHLLLEVLGHGATSSASQVGLSTPELATRGWAEMPTGHIVTASVLESGVPPTEVAGSGARLLLVDVRDGSQQSLATGTLATVAPSPNRDHLVLLSEQPGPSPAADRPPQWDNTWQVLELRDRQGRPVALAEPPIRYLESPQLRWSPDSRRLAVLGTRIDGSAREPVLHLIDVMRGTVRPIDLGAAAGQDVRLIAASALQWQGDAALLLRVQTCADECPEPSVHWWSIGLDGGIHALAVKDKAAVSMLWPLDQVGQWAGWVEHGLVLFELGTDGALHPRDGAWEADRIEWPPAADDEAWPQSVESTPRSVVLSRAIEGRMQLNVVDLASRKVTALPLPHPAARLRSWDQGSRSAVFVRDDEQGLWAWRVQPDSGDMLELFHGNAFLEQIESIDARRFHYRSEAGETLAAWLLRPAGTSAGRALPLLTYVYPGSIAGEALPWSARANVYSQLHLRIPLTHGYAVLMPSMPLAEDDNEPMARFTGNVMPAVDQLLREGLVDPKRLYLMGHSYGGYATLGMIARSNRFAAAIALAGASNLIDEYGQFDPRKRYQDDAMRTANFGMLWLEDGQGRMAAPPWREPERYMRNSPLFQVEDVTTPVMLIQGDLDAVPIEQGEQFFSALYRLGKRGRFVRYWGEGHLLRSPANIRDMWQRIFDWLDEFQGD